MSENITEIIGFDLGHGETALSRLYLADSDKKSEPELIEMFGKKNQITAIAYHPDGGILIGESALIRPNVGESYITFKRKPNGDSTYQRIMRDYIKTIYDTQREQGRINENESFFIVGCPSAWTQDPEIITAYEKLFLDAGIQQVKVVAESRAAYIHAVEKGILKMAESKGSVVVIDLGSSTTDITLINQISSSIPIDVGRELGAAAIDKAIFQYVLQTQPNRAEFEKIFNDYPHFQNRCELGCRQAKEAYFSNPEDYQEPGTDSKTITIQRNRYFVIDIDATVMNQILNTPFVELEGEFKTWPAAFENELAKLKQELELRQQLDSSKSFSPGVIFLTGGASRMDFVQKICKKIFPQATVKLDDSPEFSIAKGLARWGRVEINTSQFSRDIEQFCLENIKPKVVSQIDIVYDSIAAALADRVIDIIKRNFDLWKSRNHFTVDKMQSSIDREIKDSLQEENLSKLFGNKINSILTEIADKLRADIKELESKYGIPGSLGNSFDLGKATIGNISLGSQTNIDATDGMISGLSSVVGWISGVLAAVVAYAVAPTVLTTILVIITTLSTTLGTIIVAILLTNPGGLLLIGAVLATAGFAGSKAKEKVAEAVENILPSYDFPIFLRNLVDTSSVYSNIDEQRKMIIAQVTSKLKKDDKIRQELTDKITNVFEKSLKEKAEEMRTLIG